MGKICGIYYKDGKQVERKELHGLSDQIEGNFLNSKKLLIHDNVGLVSFNKNYFDICQLNYEMEKGFHLNF